MKRKIISKILIFVMILTMFVPVTLSESNAATSVTYTWPTKNHYVASDGDWGYQPNDGHYRDYHYGIDIADSRVTSIYAAADGNVIFSGNKSDAYGNTVLIKHSNGQVTRYSH